MKSNAKIVFLLLLFTLLGLIMVNELTRNDGTSTPVDSKKFMRRAIDETKRLGAISPSVPVTAKDTIRQPAVPTSLRPVAPVKVEQPAVVQHPPAFVTPEHTGGRTKVAFAITITRDGSVIDGACVLAYSVIKAHEQSDIDVNFIAFVHPTVTKSLEPLARFGYKVIMTPTPVNESAIQGKFLRDHINDKAGCCGAKELLKLYSYRMTQFDWVIHVDVDVLFLKGLDELFRLTQYSILYTTDPNMAGSKIEERQPAQGGFLVIRPNIDDYNSYIDILIKGDYRSGSAWGGTKIGWFWGGKTIQGIVPYFYNKYTTPGRSLILDRCIYNTMADTENCSKTPLQDIVSAHFTVCQKPWSCAAWQQNPLCVALHKRWFELRIEAEQYYSIPVPDIKKHCARGKKNYQGIDASKASVPERFLKRFNKVPIPTLITPTCHSGYVGLDGC